MFRRIGRTSGGELTDLRLARERGLETSVSHDHERLLEELRRAGPTPVTVRALTAAGVPNPAALIYELEVAGEAIEHVYASGPHGHKQLAGFRLRAVAEEAPARDRTVGGALIDLFRPGR